MLFTFGPNETYFFDDENGNRRWRAGPDLNKYMASNQIGAINAVALGEGGAFFLSYSTAGGLSNTNYFSDPENKYTALRSWLFDENLAHDRKNVAICLGANGAFFAASSQGHRWRNIPEGLSDYYQKFTRVDLFTRSRVNTADIGHGDAFLGIGVDNVWFWNLGDEYAELSKMIGQKGVNACTFITINPFAPNQHFVVFNDKTAHWSLPPHWINDMQSLFQTYATKAGAYIPQRPKPNNRPPPLPARPTFGWQSSNQPTTYSAPTSPQTYNPATSGGGFDYNQAMGLTQSALDALQNNSSPTSGSQSTGGSSVDFNQAMSLTQSALDAYNNVQGQQSELVNGLTNTGLMIGQLGTQAIGGTLAAACSIM